LRTAGSDQASAISTVFYAYLLSIDGLQNRFPSNIKAEANAQILPLAYSLRSLRPESLSYQPLHRAAAQDDRRGEAGNAAQKGASG